LWRGCERKKNFLAKTSWSAEAVIQWKFKRNREEKGKTRGRRAVVLSFTVTPLICERKMLTRYWQVDKRWQSGKYHHHLMWPCDSQGHIKKCYVSHDVSRNTSTNRSSIIITIALFTMVLAIPKVKISKLGIARQRISKRVDFPKEYL